MRDLLAGVLDTAGRMLAWVPVQVWFVLGCVGVALVCVGTAAILQHRHAARADAKRRHPASRQVAHGGRATHPEFDLEIADRLIAAAPHFEAWRVELDNAAGRADRARRRRMERQRT